MPSRWREAGARVDRRLFLAAIGASAAACAAPARPAKAIAAPARPFAYVDAAPAFFAFWSRAEREPVAQQIARFRDEVVAAHAELYAPDVLGLHGDDPRAALDARLAAWLPTLPALVPRMRDVHARFEGEMDRGLARFRAAVPSFGWDGTVYLFASVDAMNGGTRKVGPRLALLFGLDVMAKPDASMPPPVLFTHELFHTHQSQVLPSTPGEGRHIYDALWAEGLATYASLVVCPEATESEALPLSHLHDPAHPALDIPARRVVFGEVMPRYARSLGTELLAAFDSHDEEDYAAFFLGRASPKLGERPVRSGYWFGLRVARAIANGRSLDALSRLPASTLEGDMRAALRAIVDRS